VEFTNGVPTPTGWKTGKVFRFFALVFVESDLRVLQEVQRAHSVIERDGEVRVVWFRLCLSCSNLMIYSAPQGPNF
jgi:hypothetical protein